MTLPIVVQKYGGSSVSTVDKLRRVAELIADKQRAGHRVVVVVSAMGDMTDELLEKAKQIAPTPDGRELDMLLSAGERISMSLLAMAIRQHGIEAVSLTGSQSGIITTASHTNARIMEVRPFRVEDELDAGRIVIVAGYQGVSYKRDVTTLGRGGSDTTAVALAAALDAEACEIYSDVDGVYSADPRTVPNAQPLPELGYEEMQELAEAGARVLNAQAVEFAKTRNIAIYARRTGSAHPGTVVRRHAPTPPSGVRGIAHVRQLLAITAREVSMDATRGVLASLESQNIPPKQLSYAAGALSFVLSLEDLHHRSTIQQDLEDRLGMGTVRDGFGAVSMIGEGINRDLTRTRQAWEILSTLSVTPACIDTSSFRTTFIVPTEHVEPITKTLHDRLGLADPSTEAQL